MNFTTNIKLVLSSIILVWAIIPTPTYACSCGGYLYNFCEYSYPNNNIVLLTITENTSIETREAKIIENIHNEIEEEYITVLGQDGLNCGELLGDFEVGDTLIMALNKEFDFGDTYYLDGCGRRFLNYSDSIVSGYINVTGLESTQEYAVFKENIEDCLMGVDIEDQVLSAKIQIYPTLTTDKITIKTDKNTIDSIHIYSFNGELVKQIPSNTSQLTVDTMDLPKGVYYVAVEIGGQTVTKKVVKM